MYQYSNLRTILLGLLFAGAILIGSFYAVRNLFVWFRTARWHSTLQQALAKHLPPNTKQLPQVTFKPLKATGKLPANLKPLAPLERPLWKFLPLVKDGTPVARWKLSFSEGHALDMYRVVIREPVGRNDLPSGEMVVGVDKAGRICLVQMDLQRAGNSECGTGEVPYVLEFYSDYRRYGAYWLPSRAIFEVYIPTGSQRSTRIYFEELRLEWDAR